MEWLVVIGVICLIGGWMLIFSSETLRKLGEFLNKPVAYVDNALLSVRIPAGIAFVVIGGWAISVAFNYPELWYMHLIGVIILFFGLLYLFLPQWLTVFSKVADQILLSTDELVLGARKTFGIILLIVAIYIILSVYLVK